VSYELPWYQKVTEQFLVLLMVIAIGMVGFMALFLAPSLFLADSVQIAP
jgi:hypothetical protein